MRYVLYTTTEGDVVTYKLYLETFYKELYCYEFVTDVKEISNTPGLTRLFGKQISNVVNNYFLYPISTDSAEAGEYYLREENDKFIKVYFPSEDDKLQGDWIFRFLNDGKVLFWKPIPEQENNIVESKVVDLADVEIEKTQKFAIFNLEQTEQEFRGIAVAEGAWTGLDFRTTLFRKDIVAKLGTQMAKNLEDMIVDFDHSEVSVGKLTLVKGKNYKGIEYVYVEGITNQDIPYGAGLSITINSKIKWDNNLNVFVLVDAEALGVSIMTEGRPACSMCMIQ